MIQLDYTIIGLFTGFFLGAIFMFYYKASPHYPHYRITPVVGVGWSVEMLTYTWTGKSVYKKIVSFHFLHDCTKYMQGKHGNGGYTYLIISPKK
jgi:hypothetical protein